MFSCTICLIRNSDTPMTLTIDMIDSLELLSVMACILPTNSAVLYYENNQNDASELLYLHNHHWTSPTLFEISALFLDWYSKTLKSSYWSFWHECQSVQYSTVYHFQFSAGGNVVSFFIVPSWESRICQLHSCRRVRPLQQVSWISYYTIGQLNWISSIT